MRATGMNKELDDVLFGLYHILLNFFLISNPSSMGLQELQFPRFPLTFLAYSFNLLGWSCQFFEYMHFFKCIHWSFTLLTVDVSPMTVSSEFTALSQALLSEKTN